jgi:hypothetical protein
MTISTSRCAACLIGRSMLLNVILYMRNMLPSQGVCFYYDGASAAALLHATGVRAAPNQSSTNEKSRLQIAGGFLL